MYTSKKNVLQLVALLKAHGIRHIVLTPGSRNSPVTHSIIADDFFRSHSVVDERSAGFYALGIILHTGQPAAVCCTSGTAVLNLGPSVAEAFYQQLPLLVITADRPEAWIGQLAGQTVPQANIFRTLVRKSVSLPDIKSSEDEWHCNRLINEAILELQHASRGPVQINIPLSEPLFEYTEAKLPHARQIRRSIPARDIEPIMEDGGYADRFHRFRRRMIIVGQLTGKTNELTKLLESLAEEHNCIILAEHLSNIHSPFIIGNFDTFLYALPKDMQAEFAPDLLISFGGHIVSKRIRQFLQRNTPQEHWLISPSGEVVDTYQCLTDIIEADPLQVLDNLASGDVMEDNEDDDDYEADDTPYAVRWGTAIKEMPQGRIGGFSDMLVIKELMNNMPRHSSLHLANSNSVRLAQLFPIKDDIKVFCNRGTSGIDGCLSTAVGYAAASDRPTFLLIGDLAFFYDMNGLWNRQLSNNLRILLNNNGGGEIFHALPGLNKSEALDSYVSAHHQMTAKAWAEATGFTYLSVSNESELKRTMYAFTESRTEKPILLEAFTDIEKNTAMLRAYYHELKIDMI